MFNFIAQILSSDTEQGSFSRLSGLLIVLALIAWATVIILAAPAGQKTIPDVPQYWLWLVVALYGVNKGFEAAKIILPQFSKGAANAGAQDVTQ